MRQDGLNTLARPAAPSGTSRIELGMKRYEQIVAGALVGSLVIIALANTLRGLLGYLMVLAALLLIFRLLLGDRGGR